MLLERYLKQKRVNLCTRRISRETREGWNLPSSTSSGQSSRVNLSRSSTSAASVGCRNGGSSPRGTVFQHPGEGLQFLFATIKPGKVPVVDTNVFHLQVENNSVGIAQGHLSNTPSQIFSKQHKKDRGEVNQALCRISGSFSGVLPRPRSEPCFVRAPNSGGQARTCGTRAASRCRGPPSKVSTLPSWTENLHYTILLLVIDYQITLHFLFPENN